MFFAGQQSAEAVWPGTDGGGNYAGDEFDPANAYPASILMGLRWYNPTSGHFYTRDPQGYAGGINLYAYCRNNPVGHLDPMGYHWYNPANCGITMLYQAHAVGL